MAWQVRLLHPIEGDFPLPRQLNNPFYYEPHPLCVHAASEVRQVVAARDDWAEEVARGKMFGVLVVEQGDEHELSYLCAYSGQIGGRGDWPGFVPAIYDYLQPSGRFRLQEAEIVQLGRDIEALERDEDFALRWLQHEERVAKQAALMRSQRELMQHCKERRDELRRAGAADEAGLVRESQHQKADFHRMKVAFRQENAPMEEERDGRERLVQALKRRRHELSDALQRWLFRQFMVSNARGELRSVLDIFADRVHRLPPAGTGECCAPKLLHYAFTHGLRPRVMGEFWMGKSPTDELRREGHFYAACASKCKPLLGYMLEGIDVDDNKLDTDEQRRPTIIYEDDCIIVANKPEGMLSVPGRGVRASALSLLREEREGQDRIFAAHRLDMPTSGLLVLAKSITMLRRLQEQFAAREVHKEYIALLDGNIFKLGKSWQGEISLPLIADYDDHPRQKVDYEKGKPSLTRYEVIDVEHGKTRVRLRPFTGRTHQLRVHCAHADGLGCPIVGDVLYGTPRSRLYLQAYAISFCHPATGERMRFEIPFEF